ncbi:archaeosine biosynthesis radical SAM protein RaSEA [Methanosarcinaceae archaeon]|nr:archaeosine biosynthesis radical SAM protein RaSEA [Methanosarcinaceae archaeon]
MTLNDDVLSIRLKQRIKPEPFDRPAACWLGKDNIRGEIMDVLTVIFRTSGCFWGKQGGCTMCGYVYDSAAGEPTVDDLMSQLENALLRAEKKERFMVKIFTSGSFLDEKEISREAREKILGRLAADERVACILAETRPEFVTDENAADCARLAAGKPMEFAYGLETTSDRIRLASINKGFSFAQFRKACGTARSHGLFNKGYLMLKPPFLSEKEAMDDILRSIDEAEPYVETISVNLCNVQSGTYVERLWERGEFRPPWLWTIVEILKKAKTKHPGLYLMSDPVGAGAKRGPRNCRLCSHDVADMLRDFSVTQDITVLDRIDCDCRKLWEKELLLDDMTFGSPILDR